MWRRELVWLLLAAATLACPSRSERSRSEVRLQLEAEPAHLNPLLSGDAIGQRVALGDIVEPLWSYETKSGRLRPMLATSWRREDGDRQWTFALRQGVRWHDGQPFDAADVVFTFRVLRDGDAPTPFSADFDDIESVEAIDRYTVRFKFRGFRLGRDRTLAQVPILPEHVFAGTKKAAWLAHPTSRAPIGTGPFFFVKWQAGRAIVLRRFRGHWAPSNSIDHVTYRVVADSTQAMAQLRSGQLHLLAHVNPSALRRITGDARFQTHRYSAHTFTAVAYNHRVPPFGDRRVRRAMTMLLDRETIVREIFEGQAAQQHGPWANDDPASDANVRAWPFSPDAARALLAEAGVTNLKVEILYPQTSRMFERAATVWQQDAKRAGVTIILRPAPFDVVVRRAFAGDYQGVALAWRSVAEQDFFHPFHSSQIGEQNYTGFANADVDLLLERIRTTPARDERTILEHTLHRKLHDLEPITIFFAHFRTAVTGARLASLTMTDHGPMVRDMKLAGARDRSR